MFRLDPLPKVISFDCYGTLVQWREVLRDAIAGVLGRRVHEAIDPFDVLDTFSGHAHSLEQSSPHRAYKRILREGFTAAFADRRG